MNFVNSCAPGWINHNTHYYCTMCIKLRATDLAFPRTGFHSPSHNIPYVLVRWGTSCRFEMMLDAIKLQDLVIAACSLWKDTLINS
jgi:hypothetical protein